MTTPPSNEAVEAALCFCRDEFSDTYNWKLCWNNFTAARILTAEVERLRARVAELEELIGLASTSFSMLEAYLGPQWFEAVSNMELVGPDKVHASAARAKKEGER